MANPWLRLYAEIANDPKVQSMSEALQRRLVMLFCLRCSEVLATLSDEDLAFQLRISADELAKTKAIFIHKGFIEENWNLKNWDKRQRVWDQSAGRTRDYRARMRDGPVTSHVTVRDAADTETDTEAKEKKHKKGGAPALELPSWLPHDVWMDWHQFRNARKGWTSKARQLSLGTLEKLYAKGFCPRDVVNQSIERGWAGLFGIRDSEPTSVVRKATLSKTMGAILALEEMKYGLDQPGIIDGISKASLSQPGGAAGS